VGPGLRAIVAQARRPPEWRGREAINTIRRMRRSLLLGLVVSAVFALTASSQADYFILHGSAVSHARVHFHLLGYLEVRAQCKPQNMPQGGVPGHKYHRWTCTFAAGKGGPEHGWDCVGRIQIFGSLSPGYWRYRVLTHAGPCPHGVEPRQAATL